jgi:hypothetical protein
MKTMLLLHRTKYLFAAKRFRHLINFVIDALVMEQQQRVLIVAKNKYSPSLK